MLIFYLSAALTYVKTSQVKFDRNRAKPLFAPLRCGKIFYGLYLNKNIIYKAAAPHSARVVNQ